MWIAEEAKNKARKNPSASARANVEEDVTFIVDETEARNGGISNISNIPDIPEGAWLRDGFVSLDPGFESGDASNYEVDAGYAGYQEDQNNQGRQGCQGGQGGQCHEMPPTSPRASITCLDLMTTHGRRAMPSGPSYHSSNSPITDH